MTQFCLLKITRIDFYPTVAIDALVKIIKNPSLSVHYQKAIRALGFIIKRYKDVLNTYKIYKKIMPPFISILQSGDGNSRQIVLKELKELVSIASKDLSAYLDEIFEVIGENWATASSPITNLVEEVGKQLGEEFRVYLPRLIPAMLKVYLFIFHSIVCPPFSQAI